MFYGIAGFGLIGGLVWYFVQTKLRLDKDPDQHHLASLLIAVAAGEKNGRELRTFVDAHSRSPHDRSVRVNHAVRLAGTKTDAALQQRVVAAALGVHRT